MLKRLLICLLWCSTAFCSCYVTVDDRIIAPNVSATSDWSLSVWIKLATTDRALYYVVGPDASSQNGLYVAFTNDKWGWFDGTNITLSTSAINVDTWYNLIVTNSSNTYAYYLNGVSDGGGVMLDTDFSKVILGVRGYNDYYFYGQIDEFALWDTVLTSNDIALLSKSKVKRIPLQIEPANLLLYLPLDDWKDGQVRKDGWLHENDANCKMILHMDSDEDPLTDSSGNGNSCALYAAGEPNFVTATPFGDGAYAFDGSNDYAEKDVAIVSAYPFSFSAWINTTASTSTVSASAFDVIISVVDTTSDLIQYSIASADSKATIIARNTATGYLTSSKVINDGSWHHIVGVFTSNTSRSIYVDGDYSGENTTSITFSATDRVSVGRYGDASPGQYFAGTIDEPAVYNRALTADEIMTIFRSGCFVDQSGNDRHGIPDAGTDSSLTARAEEVLSY